MKKKILLLTAALSVFTASSGFAKPASFEKQIEKRLQCPKDFLQNPPLYFYCIYRDYHNHKYDDGIKKIKLALKEVEPILKENPNKPIPNAKQKLGSLKDPRAFKVASDLHMLLGMFYYKKAMNLKDTATSKVFRKFYSKLEKKGFNFFQVNELMTLYSMKKLFPENMTKEREKKYRELLKKMDLKESDLDRLMEESQAAAERVDKERLSLLQKAVQELQTAVKLDPNNAEAYYQLGNFYSGAMSEDMPEASEAAEEAYYKAALILKKEGDTAAYKEVVKRLKLMNPNSKYLKLLEKNGNA
ncbi:tetratricopeptide repeat protein [Thermovibrio ammonificans]